MFASSSLDPRAVPVDRTSLGSRCFGERPFLNEAAFLNEADSAQATSIVHDDVQHFETHNRTAMHSEKKRWRKVHIQDNWENYTTQNNLHKDSLLKKKHRGFGATRVHSAPLDQKVGIADPESPDCATDFPCGLMPRDVVFSSTGQACDR